MNHHTSPPETSRRVSAANSYDDPHYISDPSDLAAAKYRDEMWALQQYLKVWKD